MWGLVLVLVVLVLLLGLGYLRLLSALKDLQEQIQKKLQNGSGVRLTSQVSKKELVALTKQVSDLFDQIERTNRIAFQEKKTLDMAISNIAHDIRTPLTIASGSIYPVTPSAFINMFLSGCVELCSFVILPSSNNC